MSIRLGHVELFVANPLRSLEFYRDVLGFELVDVQEGRFVWVRCGVLELLLRPERRQRRPTSYPSSGVALVLYTDDLDATTAELEKRGLSFRGTDGSDRCLTFSDPDGHWFQLVNPSEVK